MRIAIIKQQGESEDVSYQNYVADIVESLQKQYGYQLINYTSFNKKESLPQNAFVVFECDQQTQLTLQWFYEISLPGIVKKTGIDLLVHLNGCLSLSVKQPQILVIPSVDLLQNSSDRKALAQQVYSKKKLPEFIAKASSVITYSDFAKNTIESYVAGSSSIQIIHPAAQPVFKPVEWDEKEQVKYRIADESEYFIVLKKVNNDEELMLLLKAFSVFKKWQQSNMKLIFQKNSLIESAEWKQKIASYKYRNDVKIIDSDNDDYAASLASSYASIHISTCDGNVLPLVQAMQSEIPVIASSLNSYKEIAGESALYEETTDADTLGNNLVRMYKNEQMRNMFIYNAKLMITHYNYNAAAMNMKNIIEQAAGGLL
jgi:glycosyltransferase involved in cell wall biosynthesis